MVGPPMFGDLSCPRVCPEAQAVVNPLPAGLLRLRHQVLQGSYEFPHSSSRQRRVAGTSLSRFGRAPPFRSLSQNGYGFAAPILAHMWLPKAA